MSPLFRVNSFVTNTLSLFVTAQIEGRRKEGGRVQTELKGGHLKFNMELTVSLLPKNRNCRSERAKTANDTTTMARLMLTIGLLTAVLREAWATLPESSSRPLQATLAQSRNLAHASLKTAVQVSAASKLNKEQQ